mmetsp:Transcript_9777/g.15738  ORF Transcript_9777/g.15738 Transcript_9777/m.15738 type:complete len:98 (+) Transcript_9777:302-595(+)
MAVDASGEGEASNSSTAASRTAMGSADGIGPNRRRSEASAFVNVSNGALKDERAVNVKHNPCHFLVFRWRSSAQLIKVPFILVVPLWKRRTKKCSSS